MKTKSLSALDHKIWQTRKEWPTFKKLLIAVSGGLDSLVLLSIFSKLAELGCFEVVVAHIHHGAGSNQDWRDQAQEHMRSLCTQWNLPFVQGGPASQLLSSEAEMREFRYHELYRLATLNDCQFILTAHHADDLLETRLIRLLRGTGPKGLEALRTLDGIRWRPLLAVSRKDLLDYAIENDIPYLDDPSNQDTEPLRNWVRHQLLPFIEVRQEGMTANLSRSLQHLVEAFADQTLPPLREFSDNTKGFEWSQYLLLPSTEQRRFLAEVFQSLGVKNFSQGQIEEVHKRLDKSQKQHTFSVGSVSWSVDARHVYAKATHSDP
jgi:tRNA(Ile)-lysidine synthase